MTIVSTLIRRTTRFCIILSLRDFLNIESSFSRFKKTTGEIVSVEEIAEWKPLKIKNFGIWLRYDFRSSTHNMYRCHHPVLHGHRIQAQGQGPRHPDHQVEGHFQTNLNISNPDTPRCLTFKFKKTTGEIVSLEEIGERKPLKIKNFGIWLRHNSRSGTHHMYCEYRNLAVSAAITQCYRDMGARHRARAHAIQKIR
jgi:ribosomal protein L20A (L18A)